MNQHKLFQELLELFNISKEEYENHREFYNLHFDEYGNEIYGEIKTRLVNLDNFLLQESWFNKRFDLLWEYLPNFDQIIDVGYGLPYCHLNGSVTDQQFVFIDKYDSAEIVSREILAMLGNGDCSFITGELDDESLWEKLANLLESNRLLVSIETIEHLPNPEEFWNLARKINPDGLVVSLPIGPKIPSHHFAPQSVDEVREYFSRYMRINEELIIEPEREYGTNLDKYKLAVVYGNLRLMTSH